MPEQVISWKCSVCERSFSSEHEARECEKTDSERPCQKCADGRELSRVDHPLNSVDWDNSNSSQSYQVYKCKTCGEYWGCRHQYDGGTGSDDRWKSQGKNPDKVTRHY